MAEPVTPTVRVLFFSALKEIIGAPELALSAEASPTGTHLLDHLERIYPALRAYRPYVRLAVNEQYAEESRPLQPGDTVALITPVSGG